MDELLKQDAADPNQQSSLTDIEISIDLKNYSQNLITPSPKVEADIMTFLTDLINSSQRISLINDPFLVSDLTAPASCLNLALEVIVSNSISISFQHCMFIYFLFA